MDRAQVRYAEFDWTFQSAKLLKNRPVLGQKKATTFKLKIKLKATFCFILAYLTWTNLKCMHFDSKLIPKLLEGTLVESFPKPIFCTEFTLIGLVCFLVNPSNVSMQKLAFHNQKASTSRFFNRMTIATFLVENMSSFI